MLPGGICRCSYPVSGWLNQWNEALDYLEGIRCLILWRYLGRNHGRGLMRLAILGTIGRKLTFCKIWEKVFM